MIYSQVIANIVCAFATHKRLAPKPEEELGRGRAPTKAPDRRRWKKRARPKRRKVRRSWKISLPRTSAQFFGGSHASISEGVDSPSELPGLRVWHSKSLHQLQHQLVGRPVSAMAGGIGSHWQILDRLVWYLDCRGQQCRGYMPRAYVGAEEELVQGEVDAVPPETVGRLGVKLGGQHMLRNLALRSLQKMLRNLALRNLKNMLRNPIRNLENMLRSPALQTKTCLVMVPLLEELFG